MTEINSRSRNLSHTQFAQLVKSVEMHRDGVSKCTSWAEASRFIKERLSVEGLDLPVTPHSVQEACGFVGVATSRRRPSTKRDYGEFRESLCILSRAIARLYEKLGEPMTPGFERLVAVARREGTVDQLREELNIAEDELDRQARDRPGHPVLPPVKRA